MKFSISKGFTPLDNKPFLALGGVFQPPKNKYLTGFTPIRDKSLTGFTLIELLMAISILMVGVVGILAMFPLGLDIGKSSQMASTAVQLGQAKMEDLISKPYDEILAATAAEDYGAIAGFSAYKRQTVVNYVFVDGNKKIYPEQSAETDTGIKKATVLVFWKSPFGGSEKNIAIASLISKK